MGGRWLIHPGQRSAGRGANSRCSVALPFRDSSRIVVPVSGDDEIDISDGLGGFRIALILALVAAIVALIPDIGMIRWYVGIPVAALVLILAVVTLIRGRAGHGMFLLVCALVVPGWCWFSPLLSSGKVAAMLNGQPEAGAGPVDAPPVEGERPGEPGAGSQSPPVRTEPPVAVEPIEEAAPMFAMREWTSADGRKMRAELSEVIRNDDGLFAGRFIRDDGKEFEMPVGKLCPEDLEEIKKAMGIDQAGGSSLRACLKMEQRQRSRLAGMAQGLAG